MLFWFGTGADVRVRSPADELEEPEVERSAGEPVELAFAMQYFVPMPSHSPYAWSSILGLQGHVALKSSTRPMPAAWAQPPTCTTKLASTTSSQLSCA